MKKKSKDFIQKRKAEFAACKNPEELNAVMHKYRSYDMLTVKDLIEFLKTCNPEACVVAYEQNSNAYIEQLKDLPNQYIETVEQNKKREIKHLQHWYKGSKDKQQKINKHMKELYRYVEDDDVVIRF